ncbi:glycosyltransferase family 39 protein [Vibrio natriegens]|uniref:ArnT family glycosyltransferase n=1 Tax=Vibrio natriegens TaxID=691 RepID=UPI0021E88723|nr:glycosyltransferase family 39 protein [Vibrio natriegens]UYI49225.1 glycosyltransferase family 39 protein [Vibrio natriegens]
MTSKKATSPLSPHVQYTALALFAALFFIAVNVCFRPTFPIDETRYISVAWEMWFNNSWLVPHLNGLPYDHKPPLMFWLFSAVWSLFGTSDTVTRLVVPGFALVNLYLVGKLAEKIYPDSAQAKWLSPLILISFLGWFLYSSMIMFDLILAVFLQLAVLSFWRYTETERDSWSYLSGVCLGLGMLTKGPVVFVYFIPFLLLAHLWHPSPASINKAFFKATLKTVGIAIVVTLLWAVPAAISGGEEYAKAIFWGQSAGRVQDSFAHARPFYWYVSLLPALLFPWLFLISFWRNRPWIWVGRRDTFCFSLFVFVVGIFSCFSGKQIHYLLPIFPFIAIWIAKRLDLAKVKTEPAIVGAIVLITLAILSAPLWVEKAFRSTEVTDVHLTWSLLPAMLIVLLLWKRKLPIDRLALNIGALLLSLSALMASLSPVLNNVYDVTETGRQIHQLQSQGHSVSYVGKYHNTFGFAGKLEKPLNLIPSSQPERNAFLTTQPGYTIWVQRKKTQPLETNAIYMTPYRGRWLFIVDNQVLANLLAPSGTSEAAEK